MGRVPACDQVPRRHSAAARDRGAHAAWGWSRSMTKASLNGVMTGNEPAPKQGTAGGGTITGHALNRATDIKEHATVEKTPSAEQASRSVAPAAELDLTGWTIPGFLHRWARETPDRGFLQWQGDTP